MQGQAHLQGPAGAPTLMSTLTPLEDVIVAVGGVRSGPSADPKWRHWYLHTDAQLAELKLALQSERSETPYEIQGPYSADHPYRYVIVVRPYHRFRL